MARFCLVAILIFSLGGCAADDVEKGTMEASILMSIGEGAAGQGYVEVNHIPEINHIPTETSVAADTSYWATDHTLPARMYDLLEDPGVMKSTNQDLSVFDVLPESMIGPNPTERLRSSAEEQIAPRDSAVVAKVLPPQESPMSGGVAATSYLIQLGALPSEESARREWARIERRHPDLVQNQIPTIVPVELDPQIGKVFRLRTGPISQIKSARSLCSKLRSQGQDCFVIKVENPS